MAFQNPIDIEVVDIKIRKPDGSNEKSIKLLCINLEVVESLVSPNICGSMSISDSTNFYNDYPLTGGEIIKIEIKTSFKEESRIHEMSISGISTRVSQEKKQAYILRLFSEEGLVNETVRVKKPLKGNPKDITERLMKEVIGTTKDVWTEPSLFDIYMLPNRMRPFDLIAKYLNKCVPKMKSGFAETTVKSQKDETVERITGSAGFFFWETYRGYNFFSVDSLCDTGDESKFENQFLKSEPHGPYVQTAANVGGIDKRFILRDWTFIAETDIMSSFRMGRYCSKVVFFNLSTGIYEELELDYQESFDKMTHLGSQDSISVVPNYMTGKDTNLTSRATRVKSLVLDHETFFNEPNPADYEEADNNNANIYSDFAKQFTLQSIVRYDSLRNQQAICTIPGNPWMTAGDKFIVELPNKAPDEEKRHQLVDEESSGVYLIKEVTHNYQFNEGKTGTMITTVRLMRDTFGSGLPSSRDE